VKGINMHFNGFPANEVINKFTYNRKIKQKSISRFLFTLKG